MDSEGTDGPAVQHLKKQQCAQAQAVEAEASVFNQ